MRPSEWSSRRRWMVTQSSRRSGSIAVAQTSAGGAAMSMLASTSLMCQRQASGFGRGRSSRRDVLERLQVAQRPLDGGVESVQPDAEQLARTVVAGQEVAAKAAHERLDERRVLARDRGRDPARDRSQAQREVEPRAVDEHGVADAL